MARPWEIVFLLVVSIMLFLAGCTNAEQKNSTPVETPTPQIVYVTILVTPTSAVSPQRSAGIPEATSSITSEDLLKDEAFIDYVDNNRIYEDITALDSIGAGSYSIGSGDSAAARKEALRITMILKNGSLPASEKVKAYRSAMMNALAEMDGSTAGFTRYHDALQTVILTKNAALSEMAAAGSTSVSAIHLSGFGNSIQSFNTTETGLKTFTLHHTGERNFAITLKEDITGKYVSLLVNEIGDYYGKKTENLKAGNYTLDITADGAWDIGISSG